MTNWDALEHFSEREFTHPDKMDRDFLVKLDWARRKAGLPCKITSDWRSKADSKAHWTGKAVDFAISGSHQRWKWVWALQAVGFRRIGVYDKHIHVDLNTEEDGFPQDVLWIGVSR